MRARQDPGARPPLPRRRHVPRVAQHEPSLLAGPQLVVDRAHAERGGRAGERPAHPQVHPEHRAVVRRAYGLRDDLRGQVALAGQLHPQRSGLHRAHAGRRRSGKPRRHEHVARLRGLPAEPLEGQALPDGGLVLPAARYLPVAAHQPARPGRAALPATRRRAARAARQLPLRPERAGRSRQAARRQRARREEGQMVRASLAVLHLELLPPHRDGRCRDRPPARRAPPDRPRREHAGHVHLRPRRGPRPSPDGPQELPVRGIGEGADDRLLRRAGTRGRGGRRAHGLRPGRGAYRL